MRVILLILPLLIIGCSNVEMGRPTREKNKSARASLSDASEVRIAACEYILTNAVNLDPGEIVYVALKKDERRELKTRVPRFDVRANVGNAELLWTNLFMHVPRVTIDGAASTAQVSYTVLRSGFVYDFQLSKTSGWVVTNAWQSQAIIQ